MTRVPDKPASDAGPLRNEPGTLIRSRTATLPQPFASDPAPDGSPASGNIAPASGRRVAYAAGFMLSDKYELLRPLGSGGMGQVWVAHHVTLDIDVAVKFIGEGAAAEAGLSERLREEARNTARLGHPAIVRALDFGHTQRGEPFIVLELLAGRDLATYIEQHGPLSPETAVATLLPVVHALSTVHESGIVHRDIKPENVFLAEVELGIQAKLLDFGISRKTDRARRITVRDTALGTPDYMSPEQARGEASTWHTDQWSLCVVLFEAITGRRPFNADNYNALLRVIIEEAPLTLGRFGLDEPELWQILTRGLAKAPEHRFASMRDLGEALALWLLDRGVQEDTVGTSLRRAWLREPSSSGRSPVDFVDPIEVVSAPALAALERASTLRQAAVGPRGTETAPVSVRIRTAQTAAHVPVMQALEAAFGPLPTERASLPDLEPFVALRQSDDLERRLSRAARLRVLVVLVVVFAVALTAAIVLLAGTGALRR